MQNFDHQNFGRFRKNKVKMFSDKNQQIYFYAKKIVGFILKLQNNLRSPVLLQNGVVWTLLKKIKFIIFKRPKYFPVFIFFFYF